jgi:diguanylate cyclase (GGDEF)-like protein
MVETQVGVRRTLRGRRNLVTALVAQLVCTLLASVLGFLLLVSLPARAAEFEVESLDQPLDLSGAWRFRTGDNPDWARADFNDGLWDNILLPRDWRRQGYEDLTGIAWYRATIQLDLANPELREELGQLGVTIGKIHSAYELYAGGRLLGTVGRLPPDPLPRWDRVQSYPIAPSLIDEEGRLTLAIRVWRHPHIAPFSTGGAFSGPFELGRLLDLSRGSVFSELPSLLLATLFMAFGLYHLNIYRRNRQLSEYLWFGLLAFGISVYDLCVSQWKHVLPVSFMTIKTVEHVTLYLLAPIGLQMLWRLLGYQPARWARAYQLGFVVMALIVALVPGYTVMANALPLWQLYVLPCLAGVILQVIRSAVNDNREARTISIGICFFIGTVVNDILLDQGMLQGVRLSPLGFATVIVTMAVSLANRFTRMYSQLEAEVAARTSELSTANQQLLEVARRDALTGLLNRRGFADQVEKEISRSGRSQRGFVLVMADVDDFKACNDRHGHACGDLVLTEIARLLREQSRDVDVLARWGGEEFVLLLPETELEGGAVLAEKLRGVVENHLFLFEDARLRLTMTFGVTAYTEGMMLDDCLALADKALYHGKDSGRNRVQLYLPEDHGAC